MIAWVEAIKEYLVNNGIVYPCGYFKVIDDVGKKASVFGQ